ncbi:MAG: DUF86 domain-containing protein [Prevotellaceae bacterium]|jgi:uncharacterized protein with HEPN domain|nr:DUF86 domain-containing protein [Prevotellaceae bacterium]
MRELIRDRGRLEHILDAIEKALEFTENVEFEEFTTNALLRYGVAKCVEIVGEASYKLTKEFREQHPEIEWRDIISMRHILVHGYYQTKDSIVWDTVKKYLPHLNEQVKKIYENGNESRDNRY